MGKSLGIGENGGRKEAEAHCHRGQKTGIYVDLVSSEADLCRSTAGISHLEGLPTLSYSPMRLSPLAHAIKRTIDVACASTLLIGLSPPLGYIAIRIKLDSAGPAFFRQDRRGLDGSRFKLVKFRTMTTDAEDRLREIADLKLHPDSVTFKAAKDPRVPSTAKRSGGVPWMSFRSSGT